MIKQPTDPIISLCYYFALLKNSTLIFNDFFMNELTLAFGKFLTFINCLILINSVITFLKF